MQKFYHFFQAGGRHEKQSIRLAVRAADRCSRDTDLDFEGDTMLLSKDTRTVIDTLLTYDEDLPNRFYSVRLLESKINKPIRVVDVLEDMGEQGLLQWGDKRHTGFRLMERARAYKNLRRLENRERWKERLVGFVSGALLTLIAWMLSEIG